MKSLNCSIYVQLLTVWTVIVLSLIVPNNGLSKMKYTTDHRIPLYIGGIFPLNGNNKWREKSQVLPAIQLALKDINNDPSILMKYHLHIATTEIPCDLRQGMSKYRDLIEVLPRKVVLLTDICTEITKTIEKDTQKSLNKLYQVSYGNHDPVFDDNYQFPHLFRLVPSENAFNDLRLKLLEDFHWRNYKIGSLYQNSDSFSTPHHRQVVSLFQDGITLTDTQCFEDNASNVQVQLRHLKSKDVQIILGNFNESWARKIFCQAYQEKIFGDKVRWILNGNYQEKWWKVDDTECFPHEIERALQRMIRIDIQPLISSKSRPVTDLIRMYASSSSKFHGYAYDAIWTIARALDNLPLFYNISTGTRSPFNQDIQDSGIYRFIDYLGNNSISFQNPLWNNAFHKALSAVKFNGVTGPVLFNNQGREGYFLLLKQFQAQSNGYEEVNVGEYDSNTKKLDMLKYPHRILRSQNEFLPIQTAHPERDITHHSHHVCNHTRKATNGSTNDCTVLRKTSILNYAVILVPLLLKL